ncbi:MAG: M48 family metalloprotease [Elainellaceae cyanobacterium]
MKRLHRFLLVVLSTLFLTVLNWQLLVSPQQSVHSKVPQVELAQSSSGLSSSGDIHASSIAPSDRLATFLEGDRLYRQGDFAAAEELYRQVKPEFDESSWTEIADPIYEAELLTPEMLAYWNNAQAAIDEGDEDIAVQALQPVVESQPEFIPATLQLAEILQEEDREDEAIALLEQAAAMYPYSAEIVMAQVLALEEEDDHLEASIAAREFALLNLDHPQAPEFEEIAEDELKKFARSRRRRGIMGGIANVVGNILTGEAPWESWDAAVETAEIVRLMLASESEFGAAIAQDYSQQLSLVDDQEVIDYVTQLGLEVAQLMGRDFDYEFYVVQNPAINASALPGGKVFVNTGAILATNSQAELAGLMGHEVAHSVLSHGIQSMFRDNLLAQFADEIPMGDFVMGLVSLHYSRNQERQSDILGNRVLATAGYAADGLRNFMTTLDQNASSEPLEYLSTHPATDSRVEYLEANIQRNGYNRYALEGVDRHLEIQAKLSS